MTHYTCPSKVTYSIFYYLLPYRNLVLVSSWHLVIGSDCWINHQ
nr:MAG TPA: hypothetical protein [Caudoviricetes sp.]